MALDGCPQFQVKAPKKKFFTFFLPGICLLTWGLFTKTSKHSKAQDRKSTRLNSSHVSISYAVFCLKKKIKRRVFPLRQRRRRRAHAGLLDAPLLLAIPRAEPMPPRSRPSDVDMSPLLLGVAPPAPQ